MNLLRSFLALIEAHPTAVIGAIVFMICVLLSLYLYTSLRSSHALQKGEGPDLKALEGTLKRILEDANGVPLKQAQVISLQDFRGGEGGEAGASAAGANAPQELIELRAQIAEQQKIIKDLEEKAAQGSGGGVGQSEMDEAQSKIADLEARLAEYEIIEDDIADISRFKEENARLRTEVENLKAGVPPSPVATPAAAPVVSPEAPLPMDEVPPRASTNIDADSGIQNADLSAADIDLLFAQAEAEKSLSSLTADTQETPAPVAESSLSVTEPASAPLSPTESSVSAEPAPSTTVASNDDIDALIKAALGNSEEPLANASPAESGDMADAANEAEAESRLGKKEEPS